jgi:hypothetical protein
MDVMTVDTSIAGRHCTGYNWYEAIAHPMEASYGPYQLGSERAMSFTVYKRWSFSDPRKTQDLRIGALQPPPRTGTPFFKKLLNWAKTRQRPGVSYCCKT